MNWQRLIIALALIAMIVVSSFGQETAVSPLAPPILSSTSSQAKQFRLGSLDISGNTHTRLYVILRMIPLSLGDIFNQSLWDFGIDQINRSGLFEPIEPADVVMKPDPATGLVDVELHLRERDRQRIDMSGGGGTTGGASVSLDYANINLTGRGDRMIGRARIGTRERSGSASYSSMLYGKTPLSLNVAGFFERLEFVNARTLQTGRQALFL